MPSCRVCAWKTDSWRASAVRRVRRHRVEFRERKRRQKKRTLEPIAKNCTYTCTKTNGSSQNLRPHVVKNFTSTARRQVFHIFPFSASTCTCSNTRQSRAHFLLLKRGGEKNVT